MGREDGEDRLLCEGCGYPIGDLAGEAACPECGLGLEASDPGRRVGSAWQRRPSWRGWWETLWAVAFRPRETFRVLQADGHHAASLREVNHVVGAVLVGLAIGVAGARVGIPVPYGTTDLLLSAGLVWFVSAFLAFAALTYMTLIEWHGIRFFGTRRGWRITPDVATVVCGHASYGWVLAGMLAVVGAAVGAALVAGDVLPRALWVRWTTPAAGGLAGFFLGLLAFETLVYVGVRACRFANRPRECGAENGGPADLANAGANGGGSPAE